MTANHSQALFYQWIAPLFDPEPENRATVVLLKDTDLENGWPETYTYHAHLLRELLQTDFRPKAVMVDLAFIYERNWQGDLYELVDVVKEYKSSDTPLFLVTTNVEDHPPHGRLLEALIEAGAQPVLAPFSGDGNLGVNYELSACKGDSKPDSRPETAAQAMAQVLLGKGNEYACPPHDHKLQVTWRLFSPDDKSWNDWITCNQQSTRVGYRMFARLTQFIGLASKEDPLQDIRQTCPPQLTIPGFLLLPGEKRGELSTEDRERLKHSLSDRIVFYGADVVGIDDIVEPPTHDPIPGVYFHAMAAENLIDASERNRSPVFVPSGDGLMTVRGLLDLLVLLALVGFRDYAHYCKTGVDRKPDGNYDREWLNQGILSRAALHRFAYWVAVEITLIIVSLAFIILVVFVGYFCLRTPPLNFLGMVGLVVIRTVPGMVLWFERLRNKFCQKEGEDRYDR